METDYMQIDQSLKRNEVNFNEFLTKMQSPVGRYGQTLHQVFSSYLSLRQSYENLAKDVEGLEIAEASQLTQIEKDERRLLLQRLQTLRKRAFNGLKDSQEHPWEGFAHPHHKVDDSEAFLRTLRIASIQLNKFWVEVQSFPVFLNLLHGTTIREIEQVFNWLQTSPPWQELVEHPRFIPYLTQTSTRKALVEFVRDVKSIRVLVEKLNQHFETAQVDIKNARESSEDFRESVHIITRNQAQNWDRAELNLQVTKAREAAERFKRIKGYFDTLTDRLGVPLARKFNEAIQIFAAAEIIRTIPKSLVPYRHLPLLSPGATKRIQEFKEWADALTETRNKVEAHFNLDKALSPETLRHIAEGLTISSTFKSLNSKYRDAMKSYRELLRPETFTKENLKEASTKMAERLLEWAAFIEDEIQFKSDSAVTAFLGPLFDGIQTDFKMAFEVNQWADQVRSALPSEKSSFNGLMTDFIFSAPTQSLDLVASRLDDDESQEMIGMLEAMPFVRDLDMAEVIQKEEGKLIDFVKLEKITHKYGIKRTVLFKQFSQFAETCEEIIFLNSRLESDPQPKQILKGAYEGVETQLPVIEQCLVYVQFIENSEIPDNFKACFLSAHGPQRIQENRALVAPALGSLHSAKDQLQKLEQATHGQVRALIDGPIPRLLSRLQEALKQPELLNGWIDYLKCEKEARQKGLSPVLDFFKNKPTRDCDQLEVAFDMAFNASLLRGAIEPS